MSKADSRLISPKYSKTQVNNAGEHVRSKKLTEEDEKIIENWRSSHNHVLNTWLVILIHRIAREKIPAITGQRLKRKNTIYDKLQRPDTHAMSLARMYDIAGCRVVFDNMEDLEDFRESMLNNSRFLHKRIKKYHKNYIKNPKTSGYRAIHDIYSYKSDPRRSSAWDGLFIEIQYRTKYQHAWSTAVEVADIVRKSRTKFSDSAYADQNRFFQYASEIIARVYENSTSCCPELSDEELVEEFKALERQLNLLKVFKSIKVIQPEIEDNDKRALIIRLHIDNDEPVVTTIPFISTSEANIKLYELEKEYPEDDIVLVKADKISSIRNIFKNYFTDTIDFIKYIEHGIIALKRGKRLTDIKTNRQRKRRQLLLFET